MFKYYTYIIFFFLLIASPVNAGESFYNLKHTYFVYNASSRTVSVGLVLVDLEKYRSLSPVHLIYNQVLSYSKDQPFGDEHGRSTNVHETVHGINNRLRNYYKQNLKKNVNAFYADDGKGIVVQNPNITMRDIIPSIPSVVKGYRYQLYFVEQLGAWNEVPTYPMDEWTAYIAGAECAVDDTKHGIVIPKSDYVSGTLEFSIYCTALAMTVYEKDPEYWNTNQQFKNAIQYFLIKSEKVFFEGYEKFPSENQDKLLENLRNHDDTKKLRDFLIKEFQGVFVD